ncbi:MAG: hypothetical protein WCL14_01715 [Bacteroidota bacterium]
MGQIKIQESTIDLKNGSKGKIAVLMYVGDDDPVTKLDSAVSKYVGHTGYHEFIDINMDNPWIRVVLSDIDEMNQVDFDPSIHKLK